MSSSRFFCYSRQLQVLVTTGLTEQCRVQLLPGILEHCYDKLLGAIGTSPSLPIPERVHFYHAKIQAWAWADEFQERVAGARDLMKKQIAQAHACRMALQLDTPHPALRRKLSCNPLLARSWQAIAAASQKPEQLSDHAAVVARLEILRGCAVLVHPVSTEADKPFGEALQTLGTAVEKAKASTEGMKKVVDEVRSTLCSPASFADELKPFQTLMAELAKCSDSLHGSKATAPETCKLLEDCCQL